MDLSMLVSLMAWGMLAGLVFATIGAAGGILTSFGLITLFGVSDPNAVKPMTQIVVLVTALVFLPGYLKRGALVWPLGLLLGLGGLAGAWVGSTLSSLYLADMATFRPLFGLLTLAIAGQIIWKLWRGGAAAHEPAAEVRGLAFSLRALSFDYGARHFRVPTWSPLLAGFVIAMTASIFGVGGGFLLVPYMASVLGLPMHIIPATAAISIFMSLAMSIGNFIARGAPVDLEMLIPLLAGALAGALLGPALNKRLKNHWLQIVLAIVVTGIGLKYTLG